MNALFQQLNQQQMEMNQQQQNQKLPSFKSNLDMLQNLLNSSNNPNSFIQNLIMNNPKMQNVMNLYQNSGLTPKQFFYNYAKSQGINPDLFLNS